VRTRGGLIVFIDAGRYDVLPVLGVFGSQQVLLICADIDGTVLPFPKEAIVTDAVWPWAGTWIRKPRMNHLWPKVHGGCGGPRHLRGNSLTRKVRCAHRNGSVGLLDICHPVRVNATDKPHGPLGPAKGSLA